MLLQGQRRSADRRGGAPFDRGHTGGHGDEPRRRYRCATWYQTRWVLCRAMMRGNSVNAHRLRYESTSPTAGTVWHGRSSGDDALWPDIAYSDVVRVWPTQDSTIGLAQDQSQAVHRKDGTR